MLSGASSPAGIVATAAAPPCTPGGLRSGSAPKATALHLCWAPAAEQGAAVQSYQVEMCLSARLRNRTGLQPGQVRLGLAPPCRMCHARAVPDVMFCCCVLYAAP